MFELVKETRDLFARGELSIPLPGSGHTARRHAALAQFALRDLSLGRIAEAHTDATAILAEAGRAPIFDGLYGVWASDGPHSRLEAQPSDQGRWRLRGTKQYYSGSAFLDAALVTAHYDDAVFLFEVSLKTKGISVLPSTWESPGLADTRTGPVSFDDVELGPEAQVGSRQWYLERPGFWHGAIGPAACGAGGAIALVRAANALNRKDPHSRAHLGALQSIEWGLRASLERSGAEIDRSPSDQDGMARRRALMVRHLIERWATEVLDRFGRATGPQLLAFDPYAVRQYAELSVYIRQCHAERDLAAIPAEETTTR